MHFPRAATEPPICLIPCTPSCFAPVGKEVLWTSVLRREGEEGETEGWTGVFNDSFIDFRRWDGRWEGREGNGINSVCATIHSEQ